MPSWPRLVAADPACFRYEMIARPLASVFSWNHPPTFVSRVFGIRPPCVGYKIYRLGSCFGRRLALFFYTDIPSLLVFRRASCPQPSKARAFARQLATRSPAALPGCLPSRCSGPARAPQAGPRQPPPPASPPPCRRKASGSDGPFGWVPDMPFSATLVVCLPASPGMPLFIGTCQVPADGVSS